MALTKVSGNFIQDGSITQGHLHASHGITTSDIGEGSNLYFTTARVDSRIGDLSTSDLSEGTNLYYTDARADARIALQVGSNLDLSSKSTSDLSEGTNLYYTQARFNTAFAAKSTSDLSEGTNLYYTDTRVGSYLTTNSYATQSYVNTQVSNLVDSAPSTLDTLNELAAALGDDANFSTTVTNSIATKLPLTGGTLTGALSGTSATFSGNVTGANLNISNWDTAYGWGDHASGGYAADSAVMKLTGNQTISGTKTFDNGSIVISGTHGTISFMDTTSGEDNFYLHANSNNFYVLADRDATDAIDGGYESPHPLQLEADTNTAYVFGSALNIGNWDTAYGWGNHASAGYLTSYTETDTLATVTARGASTTVSIESSGITSGTTAANRAFQVDATTKGALHSTSASGGTGSSADTAPLITFTGNGTSIQGGIYVSQNASTGTTLGFFTTDSYAAGPKQSLTIEDTGNVYVNRGFLQASSDLRAPIFYDSNNTGYYVDPASTSILNRVEIDDDLDVRAQVGTWITADVMSDAIGWNTSYGVYIGSNVGGTHYLRGNGTFTTGGSTYNLWHQGNDGSGSGLDADLLDGNHASAFAWSGGSSTTDFSTRAIYPHEWVRMNGGGNAGIYWQNGTGAYWHIYPASQDDMRFRTGSSNGGIVGTVGDETARGYIHWTTSNEIGFLNSGRNWSLRVDNSGNTFAAASHRAPIFYDSNDTAYYADFQSISHIRKIAGTRTNLATSEGWVEVNAWNTGTQAGYFGGSFHINGSADENNISWEDGPSGTRPANKKELIWKVRTNATDSGADGGWNKTITGIDYNKSHVSILYVKRVADGDGNFYHGTSTCLNLSGTTNGNPYFQAIGAQSLPLNVWCVSIGFLRANNDTASTSATSWSGVYRLDTGERIIGATDFRLSASTTSQHRTFLYYATNTASELWFANPGFYEINGNEPKLTEILMRPEDRTDSLRVDVDMRAPIFYDSNDTTYYIDPNDSGAISAIKTAGGAQIGTTTAHKLTVGGNGNYMNINYDQIWNAGGNLHLQYSSSGNIDMNQGGGYAFSRTSLRAPIFYDYNDTSYYLNPNGLSQLHTIDFNGIVSGTVSGAAQIGRNHAYDTLELKGYGAELMIGAQNSDIHINYRTCNNGTSGHTPTNWFWRAGSSSSWSNHYMGLMESTNSMRAPIFYDSNDTGYYIDPNGTSNTVNMKAYQYQGNGNVGGTGSASWHPSGIYSAGHNWLYGGINAGGASVTNMGDARANIFYDYNSTSYYLDPYGTSSLVTTNIDTCNWTYGRTGSSAQSNFGLNFGTNASLYMCQSTYSSGAYYQMINDTGTPIRIRHQVSSFDTTAFTDSIVIFNHNYWRGYVGILRSPEYPLDLNGQARLSGNYTTSDIRLKENVRDNDLGLSDLLQLRTVIFDWKTDEEILGRTLAYQNSLMDCRGFIAQEVEEVVPALVDTSEGEYPTKSIDGGAVTAMMVKAIQEQQAIIDDLKARIETLENQ